MNNTLQITLIQTELAWENPEANRKQFAAKIAEIDQTDLIVLPEMFTTGFSMNAKNLAEKPAGKTLSWMQEIAKEKSAAITGSVIVAENGNFYNRLYFVFPDGKYETYDKKHLFSYANEDQTYSPGKEKLIVAYKGWKICPLICYDLRFPVWSRNVEDYDVLLYVANWPKVRTQAWDILLKSRAVENMCYTAGVNRIGADGNGHAYNGHSAVYDPLGQRVSTENLESEFVETLEISKSELITLREKMAFLNDRDVFRLES